MPNFDFLKRFTVLSEKRVLNLIVQHAEACEKAAFSLAEATENKLRGGKRELVDKYIDETKEYEGEADSLRRKIIEEIASGTLPPLNREDFVRLAETMDRIADWSKSSARILQLMEVEGLPEGYIEICLNMVKEAHESAKLIKEISQSMSIDYVSTLDLTRLVKNKEEIMDELFLQGLDTLKKTRGDIKWLDVYLAVKFLEGLENLEDKCDETSDTVKMIIIRSLK